MVQRCLAELVLHQLRLAVLVLEGVVKAGVLCGWLHGGLRPVVQCHHALLLLLLPPGLGVLGQLHPGVIDHEVELLPAGRVGQLHRLVEVRELEVSVALEVDLVARLVSLGLQVQGLAIGQLHLYYFYEICTPEVEHWLAPVLILPPSLRGVLLAGGQLAYLPYAPVHALIGVGARLCDLRILFLLLLAVGVEVGESDLEAFGELIVLQLSHEAVCYYDKVGLLIIGK